MGRLVKLHPTAAPPAKLPAPASAFGLSLFGTKVTTDAAPKQESEEQRYRGVTDVGVTDAGLKELAAGLKNLQALDLRGQVTDAGLKELAGLKSLQVLNLCAPG